MIERRYGDKEDNWRTYQMIWLEGWLKEWGREHDTNELRRGIGKLIGPDVSRSLIFARKRMGLTTDWTTLSLAICFVTMVHFILRNT